MCQMTCAPTDPTIFDGAVLFNLKARHGLPLDFAVGHIVCDRKMPVCWTGFIDEARRNGRYDFQTLPEIRNALEEAGARPDYVEAVVVRAKLYMLKEPMPCLS